MSKPYRTSPRQNKILRKEIQKMLSMKIIEVGYSDYASPMILVEAPGKEPRPCVDYRNLNKTRKELKQSPLQNILRFWTCQRDIGKFLCLKMPNGCPHLSQTLAHTYRCVCHLG
ncbi:hypothetical protein AVEN_28716-1 [Araneus ventricosus]|uniref:Uncharacterized protein n=1 Tax=Araneus ventricosus TaxID=182803 RepID=A0A4Y2IB01_ARAVE|nr:hypothetical protein AVEN_28716-1 [Araneus ventricosus]